MRKIKKLISLMLIVLMLLGCSSTAFASISDSYMDSEYDAAVAEIMQQYPENPQAAIQALAKIDTVLVGEPQIMDYTSAGRQEPQLRYIGPTE